MFEPPDPLLRGVDVQWLRDTFLPHVQGADWPAEQRRCLDRTAAHSQELESMLSRPLSSVADVVQAAQLQNAVSGGACLEGHAGGDGSVAMRSDARSPTPSPSQCARTNARVSANTVSGASADMGASGGCRPPSELPEWTAASVTTRQVACCLIAPEARGHSFYGLVEPGCVLIACVACYGWTQVAAHALDLQPASKVVEFALGVACLRRRRAAHAGPWGAHVD